MERTGPIPFAARRLSTSGPGLRPIPRPRPVILVADREPALLLVACQFLEKAGFSVRRSRSAEETRSLFSGLRPDLVVLDAGLPGSDGFALCRQFRETPEGRETPIVIATDAEDYESVQKAHASGATDFVVKPINWLVLGRRLSNLLEADRTRKGWRDSKAMLREAERVACLATWNRDPNGKAVEWSSEAARLLGLGEAADLGGDVFLSLVHPEDRAFVEAEIASCAREARPFGAEHRIRRPDDGAIRFLRHWATFGLDDHGETLWIKGIVQDITEQVRAEEQIWELSNVDALTGLPNRAMLQQFLTQALAQRDRSGRLVGTLFLDIDRFEEINETHGIEAGNQLIVDVAGRLQRCLRRGDTVAHASPHERNGVLARLSGDEFVVLLPDMDGVDAVASVAKRILGDVSGHYRVRGSEVFISVSIGIAVHPPDGSEPSLLLQHAASALRQAKKAERGSFRFYSDSLNATVAAKLKMESGLHRALRRGELTLHYQPLVKGVSRKVFGFEALLRWTSPDHGSISPDRFIPVAEESGLIHSIGDWVLETACRQAESWRTQGLGALTVSVNVSSHQLARPEFVEVVAGILRETGLPAGKLVLEITESALLHSDDVTVSNLRRLREKGVRLVIDDFGTGYSALKYLKAFPVDALKIDRSFVEGIGTDEGDVAIISALISMSRDLRLTVLAEGVETEDQFRFLLERNCNEAQGFLFSRPLAAEAFEEYLRVNGGGHDVGTSV